MDINDMTVGERYAYNMGIAAASRVVGERMNRIVDRPANEEKPEIVQFLSDTIIEIIGKRK